MFRSLQWRITAGFVAVIAVAVVVLGLTLSALFAQALQQQYATNYKNNAAIVGGIIVSSLRNGVFQAYVQNGELKQIVALLGPSFRMHVRIYAGPDNTLVADSKSTAPSASELADERANHLVVDSSPTWVYPITINGYPSPIGKIVVSEPLTDRRYVLHQFQVTVVWIGVAACLLAFFIGGILSERLTAPLRTVTRAVARMGAGNLNERVLERRRDEAGELARQFNRMAARLEESFATISADRDRLRQFVADVSHELRTPLTSLRTFNDLLADGAGDDPTTRRDFLSESARQIERLDWLTHNLLDLSRLDAGITQMTRREDDLAETMRRAVEGNRPAASAKDVALALDLHPLVVAHDPPRLEQALSNIAGNAIKFSPRGGTVRARVYAVEGQAVAEVSDDGPGIPPDEALHVFDRFYRGHDANRAGEGSGLGLAIAKAIVDAHGGAIVVQSEPGRGATIRLTLPYAPAVEHAGTVAAS